MNNFDEAVRRADMALFLCFAVPFSALLIAIILAVVLGMGKYLDAG